jgi:TatD DNase family protein
VDDIVSHLEENGLESVITVGYDLPSSQLGVDIAKKYEKVYAMVGMHPHDSQYMTTEMYDIFRDLAQSEKVVAIGEIGLDYHYDLSPREIQQRVFKEQIELAHSLKLPIALHVREAYGDTVNILEDCKHLLDNGVLLHCYSGSSEMVKVFSKYDCYFAFGGPITFKNAVHNIESLKAVPLDRLLFETDAPYMTPVPFRGKTNEPKYTALVVDKASEVLGIDKTELIEKTNKNTKTLFYMMK